MARQILSLLQPVESRLRVDGRQLTLIELAEGYEKAVALIELIDRSPDCTKLSSFHDQVVFTLTLSSGRVTLDQGGGKL